MSEAHRDDQRAGFWRDDQGNACIGGAQVAELLAAAGLPTPVYLYDLDGIEGAARDLVAALNDERHLVAYAIKANSAASIVRRIASAGCGADLVSGGELEVALACGMEPRRIVMSGVAKSDQEIDRAISLGLLAIQAESVSELPRIAARAKAQGQLARVSLRVNPGVEIDSHAHIATGHDEAKFGIVERDLGAAFEYVKANPTALCITGISTHVGSMLRDPEPYLESAKTVCAVARTWLQRKGSLEFVDFGGGFGIDYGEGPCEPPSSFARSALGLLEQQGLSALGLVIEPGRALVGPFGVLATRVLQLKQSGERRWAMVDAGMNDLIRPALYAAKHRIEPAAELPHGVSWRVVGPVCESSDDFGEHLLCAEPRGVLVIRDAGAYGYAMASEYNGRALPGEIFVSAGRVSHSAPSPGVASWVKRRLQA